MHNTAYQITDKTESRKLTGFLCKEGQMLYPGPPALVCLPNRCPLLRPQCPIVDTDVVDQAGEEGVGIVSLPQPMSRPALTADLRDCSQAGLTTGILLWEAPEDESPQ